VENYEIYAEEADLDIYNKITVHDAQA